MIGVLKQILVFIYTFWACDLFPKI